MRANDAALYIKVREIGVIQCRRRSDFLSVTYWGQTSHLFQTSISNNTVATQNIGDINNKNPIKVYCSTGHTLLVDQQTIRPQFADQLVNSATHARNPADWDSQISYRVARPSMVQLSRLLTVITTCKSFQIAAICKSSYAACNLLPPSSVGTSCRVERHPSVTSC